MEYNDNEQQTNMERGQLPVKPAHGEDAGDPVGSAGFVSSVLGQLGLSSTVLLPSEAEERALQALHDEHEHVRVAAVRTLSTFASQEVAEALIYALRDSAWTVRAAAALALGRLRGQVPADPLVAALRDEDATVRATAASALGMLGAQAPLTPLLSALYDSSWMVREAAVLALGELGAGVRVPAALFLNAHSDKDEPVRQAAELVLRRLYPELLVNDPIYTAASTVEKEASAHLHQRAKLNGHGDSSSTNIQPRQLKQPGQSPRRPAPVRRRFFPRVAALAAALMLFAGMFSWLAVSHSPHEVPSSHPFAVPGISAYRAAGGSVYRVAWSPQGTEIASINALGLVQVRDTASGHVISTFKGDFLKALSLAWLPDSALLLAAQAADGTVQVWNVLTDQRVLITPPLQKRPSTATWSPDGSQVAFDGGDSTVQVWNLVTGTKAVTYKGHSGRINMLSWSPDGTEIASASDDQTVQVWNAATGNKDWPSFVHTDAVSVVAWSPDNTRCAVATANGAVEVWDNPSWNKAEIAPATPGWSAPNPPLVSFIAWSPDATHLAFATPGGPVQVWDASANRLLYSYPDHNGQVNNVAWSPDGTHIASANSDGTVQIWQVPGATQVNERLPH